VPRLAGDEQIEKRLIIARFAEDAHAAVPPIEYVINDAANRGARGARHGGRVAEAIRKKSKRWMSPFQFPPFSFRRLWATTGRRVIQRVLEITVTTSSEQEAFPGFAGSFLDEMVD